MKLRKKIIALVLSLSSVFTLSMPAYAASSISGQDYFEGSTFEIIGSTNSSNFTEIATLSNGNTVIFEHFIGDNGNMVVNVTEEDGTVNVVEFNEITKDLYYNGELVEKVITESPIIARAGNWSADSPIIYNYLVQNFTLASLAAALAAVTGGATAVVSAIIAGFFYTTAWMSAKVTTYYNYVDYAPKVGWYTYSVYYAGYDATGTVMGTHTSNISKR